MAAERIASSSRPSRIGGVSKPASGGRHRSRNDRGMEIDQVGSSTSRDSRGPISGRPNNRNNNNNNNNRQGKNNNNNKNRGGNRKPQNQKPKKTSLNQGDLDKDLEAYMLKNESTARNTLDMELDSYMSTAPSKN